MSASVRCGGCGKYIDSDSNYCKFCGERQDTEEEARAKLNDITVLRRKGDLEIKTGNYHDAIGHFEEIIELDPYDHTAWALKGHAHRHLGEFKKAVEAYEKALETNPDAKEVWFYRDLLLDKAAAE